MPKHKIFQVSLYLSLLTLFITGCDPVKRILRPTFQSDKKLVENFENNKTELLSLIQDCETEDVLKGFKRQILESFSDCDVDESVLGFLNIMEVAVEYKESARPITLLENIDGERVLFVTDYYKYAPADTFVEEKGYIYSPTPLKKDVIKESLDKFSGQTLAEIPALHEAWRYKQIEPNWYLYYRQYYYPYLG